MIAAVRRLILATVVLAAPALVAAQTYTISPSPFLLAQNNAGAIINNACIWTYTAGTTTPATTYTTSTGTPNTNPIRSDSAGRFTAFLAPGSAYKFVYESACTPPAHGTTLRTADNISATPASAASVDVTGTAGESLAVGQCVYLSVGDGGKNAGQWYKCDAATTYSSTTNWIGIATVNIATASTGTIRLAGSITGLSTLSVGTTYYVGTAGALSSSAPTNARKVGQADSATSLLLSGNPTPFTGTVNGVAIFNAGGVFTSTTAGTNGQTLQAVTGAAPQYVGGTTLLHFATGTTTQASASNVDTFTLGVAPNVLTTADRLKICTVISTVTANTAASGIFDVNDTVQLSYLAANGALTAVASPYAECVHLSLAAPASSSVNVFAWNEGFNGANTNIGIAKGPTTMTVLWTGALQLGLHIGAVTSTGTCTYSWWIYKENGQ